MSREPDAGGGADDADAGDADTGGAGTGDAGYDEFVESVAAGEGFYLACPNGHGSLPPRRVCPRCGAAELESRPLPETGTVETHTTVHVAVPSFEAETPYTTAVASFGPVRLTGVVRREEADDAAPGGSDDGAADAVEDVAVGQSVRAGVDTNATTGEPVLTLRPE
jgi:hypothetical protein